MSKVVDPQIGVERNVEIETPDGVRLRADVYRPMQSGSFPALLERTPYNKSNGRYVSGLMLNPLEAVEHGYAVVVQDVRGRFTSEGDWEPFVHEGDDGAATVEWIAAQPWCNGRVGVYGASYMGVTAIQTLVKSPPALLAGVLYMTGSDYYRAWIYSEGAFELKFNLAWVLRFVLNKALAQGGKVDDKIAAAASRPSDLLSELPIRDIAALAETAPYWRTWLQHDTYDEYWQAVDAVKRAPQITAPILHVSGWYDHFLRGHLDLYKAIEERGGLEQKFLLGPWDHGSYHQSVSTMSGDRDFGSNALNGPALMSGQAYTWFDRWLKDAPVETGPKVSYFVMGENEWHKSSTWPPPHVSTSLYLRSDGILGMESPDENEAFDSYVYDPLDPVPTLGGRGSSGSVLIGAVGVKDQSPLAKRADVLCYTTPHLMEPLTIAGPIEVTLFAAASTSATDFTAKLVDVQPDGYCAILTDGVVRTYDCTPGETQKYQIDLWAVAHRFGRGHRIRVEISGGNFPRYDRNPNSGTRASAAVAEDFIPSTHHVFHDAAHASRIVLPVIERHVDS